METIDNTHNEWKLLEDEAFANQVKCYKLLVNGKRYDVLGFLGTMHLIDKKSGSGNGKTIHSVAADSRHFLDNAGASTVIVIPYGFWTCDCEKGFVRTPFSSKCLDCGCHISAHTKRAIYLEEIKFV